MDSVDYADPTVLGGLNLYAYCNNNPVMYVDPSGHILDFILDILFIGWDIYNLATNKGWEKAENWVALVVDIAFAVTPFVTGGGQVVKIGDKVADLNDFRKVTLVGETMDRLKDTATLMNNVDNLYGGFKAYNKLSSLGKGGKVLAEIGGKASNLGWLYGKLRSGYKVVDIGIDVTRTIRSSSYIMERIFLFTWQTRNLWKWSYHIF